MKRIVPALVLVFLGFAGNVQAMLLPGTLTAADPTFDRPIAFAQGGACTLSGTGTAVHYRTHTLTMLEAGNLTLSTVPADGAAITPAAADTVIVLYGPGGFNPAAPCANAIAANDDAVAPQSRIVTTTPLAAGTYTVVVTSFDNAPAAPGALPWTYSLLAILPAVTQIPGTLTAADPTFNRMLSFAQGGTCTLSGTGTAVHYRAHPLTTIAAGNLTVSTVPADGASITPGFADTFIALYGPGGFNPAAPCTNAIAANDDAGGVQSRIVTTTPLAAGTYTVVVTSFDNVPQAQGALPWTYSLYVLGYVPGPPALQGAASRKPHGGTVSFDLPL